MGSILDNSVWFDESKYVAPLADFLHHGFDPSKIEMGEACLISFSASLFAKILESVPSVVTGFQWPYSTTPLKLCTTESGRRFAVHFPSYGDTRIANSLEQLAACGYRYVFGLGLGGTPQEHVKIGDIILLEGAIRGDGVSRYYAPDEFPAVASSELTWKLREKLELAAEDYHVGLSFGVEALYRESRTLLRRLRKLGVLTVDLESSAFLAVGRRLGLQCSWIGVVSDRLVGFRHEGNIHSEHISDALLRLAGYIVEVIDEL